MSRMKIKNSSSVSSRMPAQNRSQMSQSMLGFQGHMMKTIKNEEYIAEVMELIVSEKLDTSKTDCRGYMREQAEALGWSTNKFIRVVNTTLQMIEQEKIEALELSNEKVFQNE